MAKKKTRKTGAKPVGDARSKRAELDEAIRSLEADRAAQALSRARECAEILRSLEVVLEVAEHAFTQEGYPRGCLDLEDSNTLDIRLSAASNRMALYLTMEQHDPLDDPREKVKRLRSLIRRSDEPTGDPAATIADGIRAVEWLLEHELARARRGMQFRPPSGREVEVLGVLLRAEIAMPASAVGKELGTNRDPLLDKVTHDAVDRLRHECGFEIERTGAGYKLTARDRALAREHGFLGEVSGAETE